MKTPSNREGRLAGRQGGAVAIILGITIVVLIGFAGLAIDLGRFFVVKAELQNAMDACALSAASQLKPGANDSNVLTRADAYGRVFTTGAQSIQNRANFQNVQLDSTALQITFAVANNGPWLSAANADPNTAKFVKCSYLYSALPVYLMKVLNAVSTQDISAAAVATREQPTAACLPVAVCAASGGTVANNFGYTVGDWLKALDGSSYGTGNFGWASLEAPGSANQIKGALTGSGQCDISNPSQLIYGEGLMAGLAKEWNTRFGLYAPSMSAATAPPDRTGYAYSDASGGNWPPVAPATQGSNAYQGSNTGAPTIPNFLSADGSNLPYDTSAPQPPGFPSGQYTALTAAQQVALGRSNRRLASAPIVDCSIWNVTPVTTKNLPVLGWACVLMLNPYDESGPPSAPRRVAKLEFRGLSTSGTSPCAAGSEYAIAPVLTQ